MLPNQITEGKDFEVRDDVMISGKMKDGRIHLFTRSTFNNDQE